MNDEQFVAFMFGLDGLTNSIHLIEEQMACICHELAFISDSLSKNRNVDENLDDEEEELACL